MDIAQYLILFGIQAAIFGVTVLGANLNWGFAGLFNVGIAGFFAVGAYTSAILTAAPNPLHLGGFGLPVPMGWLGAVIVAAIIAWFIGRICLRLRSDYLAIATIGVAEIIRITASNFGGLTGGAIGISDIPRPLEGLGGFFGTDLFFLILLIVIVAILYLLCQRAQRSPWGRVMRAIRDNETAAAAAGKDVSRFRLEAFVLGSALMGLSGALSAHYFKFLSPTAIEPLVVTFLAWVMMIVGGSGNNRGVLLGVFIIWALWSMTPIVADALFPREWAQRLTYVRWFAVGLLLQIVLQKFPKGLLPERPPVLRR